MRNTSSYSETQPLPNLHGPLSAVERCDGAKVSLYVASQARSFPSFQGTIEMPSGLFPSALATPEGSKRAGIFAAAGRALWMISFRLECLECLHSYIIFF